MSTFNSKLVIVFVLQILTLVSAQNNSLVSPLVSPPISSKTNSTNKVAASNNTNTTHEAPTPNKTEAITAEGGGKINMEVTPSVNISLLHNREHVVEGPFTNNTASSVSPTSSSSSSSTSTSTTTVRNIPAHEEKPLIINKTEHTDHKKISARKGVNFSDDFEPKEKHKKPNITVGGGEPFSPSNFQSKSNSSTNQNMPKVPNLDLISENNQGKTQKYVVPIVIVILSVPFVAILISILYKRGAEWWKYRHYRRMDFLINGMYDT